MTRLKAVYIVAIVAFILAGLASWLVYDYLAKRTSESKAAGGQGIVVAATEIPVGSKINATHLKVAGWPKESIPADSFSDPKALLDRINVRPVSPGEPLTESRLMPKDGAPGSGIMSYIIPEGHRAVTVAVNEVAGVAGFLSPHNKVDVVLTTLPPGSTDQNSTISKIVLQNVPILATGQITDQKEGKPVVVPTVTIDLTPEDSEKLVVASSKGSLQMLLRGIKDSVVVESTGATISKVLGTVRSPVIRASVPKKPLSRKTVVAKQTEVRHAPPPSYTTIEIIRGTNRTSKQY